MNSWTQINPTSLFSRSFNQSNNNTLHTSWSSISKSMSESSIKNSTITSPGEVSTIIDGSTWKKFLYMYVKFNQQPIQFSMRKRPISNNKSTRFSTQESDKSEKVKSILGSFDQWPDELKDYCKQIYKACGKSHDLIAKAHRYLLNTIEEKLQTHSNLDSVRWLNLSLPDFVPSHSLNNSRVQSTLESTVQLVSGSPYESKMKKARKQKTFTVDKLTAGVEHQLSFTMEHESKSEMSAEILGTSTELEKFYFRLTSTPDVSNIRPLHVLIKSFEFVVEKAKSKDIRYLCDQLRSIRQDLTVQNIKTDFNVKVYETNAITALKANDREEFNQCQSRLLDLYTLGFNSENRWKFTGYRMLYCIFTNDYQSLMETFADIIRLGYRERLSCVLSLYRGWNNKNYSLLFRSYRKLPEIFRLVADMFIERERASVVKHLVKSFRPTLSTKWIGTQLAYQNVDECSKSLQSVGAIIVQNGLFVDCKASL